MAIDKPVAFDTRRFRTALGLFASGVTVITTRHQDHTHAMTANAFVSVSLEPPLILVSVDHRSEMNRLLGETRRFGVNILAKEQQALSDYFAGRSPEKVLVPFVILHGWPMLEKALARLVAEVVEIHPAGDHTLYVGRVEHLDWREGDPLVFFAGAYRHLAEYPRIRAPRAEDEFSLFSIGSFDPKIP